MQVQDVSSPPATCPSIHLGRSRQQRDPSSRWFSQCFWRAQFTMSALLWNALVIGEGVLWDVMDSAMHDV